MLTGNCKAKKITVPLLVKGNGLAILNYYMAMLGLNKQVNIDNLRQIFHCLKKMLQIRKVKKLE